MMQWEAFFLIKLKQDSAIGLDWSSIIFLDAYACQVLLKPGDH
jgi:hypothetical protein